MRVEHLRVAHMDPPAMPVITAHALLCHTDDGPVVVDTGFGTADLRDPARRLGPLRHTLRPDPDERHTLVAQLRERGIEPGDVAHVVLTHLDLDHAGGLSDLPDVTVHTTADEHAAAISAPDALDRRRYRSPQFEHGPRFTLHTGRGDEWRLGLTGHEIVPGITLVPMAGHSRGHAVVAVEGDDGLVVHAGDAVFDAATLGVPTPAGVSLTPQRRLRGYEMLVGRDRRRILANHRALRRLATVPDVLVVPAHDTRLTAELVQGSASTDAS